ncbi:SsrA-binding protein [Candidatus Liberibacter solanacearum]|uniref:SsrA-binding protein n=2 Tax=Candidatus Liberibacter solanacearum TaxID=556287 RepID=A0A0F4VKT1_9HYPH|nr:SsrA-binding protein SmpB [Candidatus Liberibacter solanacearum]ADR52835.1 SsrA-binding protein [Candidatus Liberibacter solanacearum CLso-ZC1]KJZ80758.1 SsrA-binding protein [Candidatus Liberibacter solanacearum]KJZ81860.1 tmRNA-binding protein SmpB [Candidatus Liberibacter solanacearum]KQC49676.1 SsrA-binding protein [Candidatus Liberibacter solanacearum]ONI58561.1 SsrA-binding protein [Candidatus Liberibacter solanacearum]
MSSKSRSDLSLKVISENRKARYNYHILRSYEAGIVLTGTEVKSLRVSKVNISESYATVENDEIWLTNTYIPEYLQANRFNHSPRRNRKLLLSKKEIRRLHAAVRRDGMTLVPMKIYFNAKGLAKIDLALAQGKKNYDKRETEKKRDWDRQKSRIMRERG